MNAQLKTRPVRVQENGKIKYYGRMDDVSARRVEAAVRAGSHPPHHVRSIRQAPGCAPERDEVEFGLSIGGGRELSFELRLMLATLEDAKASLQSKELGKRLEAARWFRSEDRSHLYAFVTICEAFNVEPEFVRRLVFAGR